MKTFKYKAKKNLGSFAEGTLSAASQEEALDRISEMGLFPISIEEQTAKPAPKALVPEEPAGGPVRSKDLLFFSRHLARLIHSGISITRALDFLSEQTPDEKLRVRLKAIRQVVGEGKSFSEAARQHSQMFSPFDIALLEAGESAGSLEQVLLRIADYRQQQEMLWSKVRTALAYPLFIVCMGAATLMFMLTYVVPQYARLFEDLNQKLPLVTRMLLAASHGLVYAWPWLFFVAGAAFFGLRSARSTEAGRVWWARFVLRLPWAGSLFLNVELVRFTTTLQMLLKSGLQVLSAVRIASSSLQNEYLRVQLKNSFRLMEEGASLSQIMHAIPAFPGFVCHLVEIGEESGKLDDVLGEISDWYAQEIQETVQKASGLLEPVLILLVGAVLGFVAVAVLLPVFSINAMI